MKSGSLLSLLLPALLAASADGAVSATGLEVYYTFDAGTTTATSVTDQWTGDGNADNSGRTALSSFSSGAKFGNALDVSTVNGTPRASTSDAATINSTYLPGTGDYTLSFWYRQGATNNNRIFSAGGRANDASNDDGLQLYLTSTNGLELAYHDPSAAGTTRDSFSVASGSHTATFDGAAWNHLAIERNGTTLSLWVNGVNVGSTTLAAGYNIAVNTGTFFREPNFGPDAAVAGAAYDDLGIWHRALTPTEIAEIYNGGTGATIGSLVPEPSTALLGALGLLGLLRRRR